MADNNSTAGIHIDRDEYTEMDEAAGRVRGKRSRASAEDTVSNEAYESAGKTGKTVGRAASLFMAKAAYSGWRLGRDKKKFEKENEQYKADVAEQQRRSGSDRTFGDVFASAFQRCMQESRFKELKKKGEKLAKREQKQKNLGKMLGNIAHGVEQAARTTTMRESLGQYTAESGGVSLRDLGNLSMPTAAPVQDGPQMGD